MATLDELIGPEGNPQARKFRLPSFGPDDYFQPCFTDFKDTHYWAGVSFVNKTSPCFRYYPRAHDKWEEYLEPKSKIVRWMWATSYNGNGNKWSPTAFYTEAEFKEEFPHFKYFKLEWSRTEFDE